MADCGGENVVMEETMRTETDEIRDNLKYLTLLSRDYPSQAAAASEIISTQALLKLPKGTEHFMSDLHGENEAFVHILNSASGVIREKVDQVLGDTVPKHTRAELATLIYYPNEKLPQLKARCTSEEALDQWYTETLLSLIDICRLVSSKHTRDHVRRCLPASCGYILDELLHAHFEDHDKDLYYGQIVGSIIENGRADHFIVRLCELIKHLAVDKLHIVGDLFDRGPRPDIILDLLMRHHNVDIQWGNHDVVWMGAAAGSPTLHLHGAQDHAGLSSTTECWRTAAASTCAICSAWPSSSTAMMIFPSGCLIPMRPAAPTPGECCTAVP